MPPFIRPLADRFQVEAWLAIQRDLLKVARILHPRAYGLGAKKAEQELQVTDLLDPRGQAFTLEFNYRSIRSLTARTSVLVEDAVREGIREGLGVDDIVKRMDRLLEGRVATVATIARTEANRAANWGRFNGWRRSGVVRRKEAIATLDDRVRPDHLEAHGEVVPLDAVFHEGAAAGKLAPPWDPNCRCTIAPVTGLSEPGRDREEADTFAREQGIDLAAKRHAIPGLVAFEDEYAAALAQAWRAGKAHLIEAFRNANQGAVPIQEP
ncbi:MAG: minor capsid protein [Halobacteriales archaeon]|nr:minor capsid protein [Halobacteriales archaeon]